MKFMFAAGDIGGARALLPVASLAATLGHTVAGLAHGTLRHEGSSDWLWYEQADACLQAASSDGVIYATSVADQAALEVAKAARSAGKPCLHLLDNWSSYLERIQALIPDAYAVMDNLALAEAKAAGVPSRILHITGHPDLAKLAEEKMRLRKPQETQSLLFVSEPAARDGGVSKRGYDENIVTLRLVEALASVASSGINLRVVPHPREDRNAVKSRLEAACANLNGAPDWSIVAAQDVRSALHRASHVAGMSSILLYEAWLLGRPTLSLQPGLKKGILRSLSHRQDLIFHDKKVDIEASVIRWLERHSGANTLELATHQTAASSVLCLAEKMVSNHAHCPPTASALPETRHADSTRQPLKQESGNAS
ncbi:MAG: hypothetical protein AB8B87_05455 [Granulosicoccus sp.]